jgi:hypothetical protein
MKNLSRSFQLLQIIVLTADNSYPARRRRVTKSGALRRRKIPEAIERNITPLSLSRHAQCKGRNETAGLLIGKAVYVVSDKSDLSSIDKAIAQTQDHGKQEQAVH